MRTTIRMLMLLLLTQLASGCLQFQWHIIVKPDGSGTIEQTLLLQKSVMEFMKLMSRFSEDESPLEINPLLDEEGLRREAREMGEGVRYLSGEVISAGEFEGYRATFAFRDISKIKLNQNPGEHSVARSNEKDNTDHPPVELVTFDFRPGAPHRLTVHLPEDVGDVVDLDRQKKDENLELLEAFGDMFAEMRIRTSLEIDGRIRNTNATFVEGSNITLMDIEVGKILADRQNIEKLSKLDLTSVDDARQLANEIDGVRIEVNEKITIEFN